uniref:G-protein coupled receptors family 1 profile domain-containing protein n=1 Tax=Plectus sambesii TaxID=2011161 RepID=A0A914W5X2_9BILA
MLWTSSNGSSPSPDDSVADSTTRLCLGLGHVFIALVLVVMIITTVFGNILVVLSVFVYKRMRTFTNILLTSLATADLLVGLVVMPLSLLDLLHQHDWPFGKFLCGIWATSDVLLCTASILNLCVISLDRYMAITSPLKYPRTRSRAMAAGLLGAVWLLSLVICSPPWFIPEWGLFAQYERRMLLEQKNRSSSNISISGLDAGQLLHVPFECVYSPSIPYRIYSALGSFYIPLLVMLSVYFKIFRVASEREAMMQNSLSSAGTYRLSHKVTKKMKHANNQNNQMRNNPRTASAPVKHRFTTRLTYESRQDSMISRKGSMDMESATNKTSIVGQMTEIELVDGSPENSIRRPNSGTNRLLCNRPLNPPIERDFHSLADLDTESDRPPAVRKNTDINAVPLLSKKAQKCHNRLQPSALLARANDHYHTNGPGKAIRGSKEKMVYLRERKALKTIGMVVLGFIICWMPFFVLYLVEVFADTGGSRLAAIMGEIFLWLGYSNSVLNPIIYTMYNGDFRRCFRDLLSCGCMKRHRRTMSVKKLHQQSTVF